MQICFGLGRKGTRTLLLFLFLLLLSCGKDNYKDGVLLISIKESPDAKCLEKVFEQDSNFAIVKANKAKISVSLDSNLVFKNLKTGSELKYEKHQTIFGFCDWGCSHAILGYEISNCDFAKKHAIDLANLSVANWDLDSSATGKMYISGGDDNFRRQQWISHILELTRDSVYLFGRRWGFIYISNDKIDTLTGDLKRLHDAFYNSPLEETHLNDGIFIYTNPDTDLKDFAKIANIARNGGFTDIIYTPYENLKDTNDIKKAKGMINYLYHGGFIDREYEDSTFFSTDMLKSLSLAEQGIEKPDIKNYLWNFFCKRSSGRFSCDFTIDFETKSENPVQINAKMLNTKCAYSKERATCKSENNVLFHFVKENEKMKISDVEENGVSLKEKIKEM